MFGLRGELKLAATRIGDDAVRSGLPALVTFAGGEPRAVTISAVRLNKGRPLVSFAGVEDADAAARFVGGELLIARADAVLNDGEYLDADLTGCRIVDAAGTDCGTVLDVLHYPAQDFLVVGKTRALVPMVREFILAVDITRKEIRVELPPGLLDPAAAHEA